MLKQLLSLLSGDSSFFLILFIIGIKYLIQSLATTVPSLVWNSFGSWLRTVRPGVCPSELVVATALRNSLPLFLAASSPAPALALFILDRLDFSSARSQGLAA